jgi:hypothetical protein
MIRYWSWSTSTYWKENFNIQYWGSKFNIHWVSLINNFQYSIARKRISLLLKQDVRIQVHIIYNENLLVRYQVERTFSTCSKSIKHTDGKFLKYNFKISITDVIVTDIFNRQMWCVWRIVFVVCCFRPSYENMEALGQALLLEKSSKYFYLRRIQGRPFIIIT